MAGFSIAIFMSILYFIYLLFVAIFVILVLYVIISYVFDSISIMSMSKKLKYKNIFTSYIPFYNKYLLGKISNNKMMGIVSGVLSLISVCISIYFYIHKELQNILFIILIINLIITFILDTIISHKIYKIRSVKYGDVFTVFNILSFGLLRPIFLFVLRNKPVKEYGDYKF